MNAKSHSFALLCCISVSLLFNACVSPAPVYRLTSFDADPTWIHGREYVVKRVSSHEVGLRYSYMRGRLLVFDVDIVNMSNSDLLVDPATFYSVPLKDKTAAHNADGGRVFAINPEPMIEQIEKSISRENASAANAALADLTLATGKIVTDIAGIGDPKSKQEPEKKARREREEESERFNREMRYDAAMRRLTDERTEWERYALRKHTLHPDETLRGSIYFPVQEEARFLTVVLSVRGEEVKVPLRARGSEIAVCHFAC